MTDPLKPVGYAALVERFKLDVLRSASAAFVR
jgi:hypothetical protein